MEENELKLTKEEKKLLLEQRIRTRKQHIENQLQENTVRARSIVVGTAFGGTCEISMRRPDGTITWALLQPVEVIEFIHQLAANVGCHIHIQPRRDFASWRDWKHTDEELLHFRGNDAHLGVGHPPHAKSDGDEQYKTSLPPPEKQPGLQPALFAKDKQNETVATKKPKNRRSSKRTTTTT